MLKLADTVKINDNGLIGEICDINDCYCYVDVDIEDIGNNKPDFLDRLFERKLEDVTLIKSAS